MIQKKAIVNHFTAEGIAKSTIYDIIKRKDNNISASRLKGSGRVEKKMPKRKWRNTIYSNKKPKIARIDPNFDEIIEKNVNPNGRVRSIEENKLLVQAIACFQKNGMSLDESLKECKICFVEATIHTKIFCHIILKRTGLIFLKHICKKNHYYINIMISVV